MTAPGPSGRTGIHGLVDGILERLRVPAEIDSDGDWRLRTDAGELLLIVDEEDLVLVQPIDRMERGVEGSAEMHVLLALNFEARGTARFAALRDGDEDLLVLTARLALEAVSPEAFEAMLDDALRLSRRVDEMAGNAPR